VKRLVQYVGLSAAIILSMVSTSLGQKERTKSSDDVPSAVAPPPPRPPIGADTSPKAGSVDTVKERIDKEFRPPVGRR
jgi:hypothetical protein